MRRPGEIIPARGDGRCYRSRGRAESRTFWSGAMDAVYEIGRSRLSVDLSETPAPFRRFVREGAA
jgi:hypothetical protein